MIISTSSLVQNPSEQSLEDDQSIVFRLAYISQTSKVFSQVELDAIKQSSLICNTQMGLCGLLIITGGRIIHILEGEEMIVRGMMEKIEKDNRHHSIKIFSEHHRQARCLVDPSLFVGDLKEVHDETLESLGQMMTNFQWSRTNPELESSQIGFLKSLALFPTRE